jgi:hypothetical protein
LNQADVDESRREVSTTQRQASATLVLATSRISDLR